LVRAAQFLAFDGTSRTLPSLYAYEWERGAEQTTTIVADPSNPAYVDDISGDGRYILLDTLAALVAGDTNNNYDAFRWDTSGGPTIRVSVSDTGTQLAEGGFGAAISSEGSLVVFSSFDHTTQSYSEVYVRSGL
jgi:hypothetical protein